MRLNVCNLLIFVRVWWMKWLFIRLLVIWCGLRLVRKVLLFLIRVFFSCCISFLV